MQSQLPLAELVPSTACMDSFGLETKSKRHGECQLSVDENAGGHLVHALESLLLLRMQGTLDQALIALAKHSHG